MTLSWNSIARGAPSAFTPEPSPRRRKFPAAPCSSALVVPFGEPNCPFSMLLNGTAGPSKLEKLNTLKKEMPGRIWNSFLDLISPVQAQVEGSQPRLPDCTGRSHLQWSKSSRRCRRGPAHNAAQALQLG